MAAAHARFLPSSIVNRIIPYVESDLMLPVYTMMASDKSDQQNFYKIMCERLFPQMEQRDGYSWKDHYYRCLAYDRGNNYTKRAVTFLKDSTLLIGRILAPIAAIKATSYFGEQYFNSNFYMQSSRSQAAFVSFEKHSPYYNSENGVEFNAENRIVRTTCPMYVSSEYSDHRSITPYLFQPKPNVKIEKVQHIYLYYSLTSDNDLIRYIANSNVMFSCALTGLTSLSSYFNQEELRTDVVVENYLKLALSTISGLVLSSFLYGTPVDDLISEMKNITTSLIAVLGLTFFSPVVKRKIIEGIHRILPNLPNIPDWGKSISISAVKTLLFFLLTPDYRSWSNFFSSSLFGTTVLMGAFLGGGIASLPIGVMSTVALASFLGTESLIKPMSINDNCSWRCYETRYMNSAFSSVLTGCVTTGLLCSSAVTTLAEKVSNGVGNFFGSIAGTVCKAAVTAKIYGESCYSYVSSVANRVYNLS